MKLIRTVVFVSALLASTCPAADTAPADMTPEELAAAIQETVERERYEELIAVAWEKYPYHPALASYTFRDASFAGDLERALEVIEEVRKVEPDNAEWISNRAVLLFDLERYVEAEEAFLEVISTSAWDPVMYISLGFIELTKGEPDLEKAKEYYEKGLAQVPPGEEWGLLDAFYDLASIYARLGELDAAFENLERVFAIDAGRFEVLVDDPNMENVRSDAGYADLAATAEEAYATYIATYATVLPGEPAPEFVLFDTDGDTVTLSDYAGEVVLVNIWATWCPPCRAEIPDIAELYDEYKDKGLAVLGISVDEIGEEFTVDDLAATSAELGVNYPVLLGNESVADAYISKAGGIPETYIVGADGIVKDFIYGMTDRETLERKILKYLPE